MPADRNQRSPSITLEPYITPSISDSQALSTFQKSSSTKKAKTSWVWHSDYGMQLKSGRWQCQHCIIPYTLGPGSTGNIINHLLLKHHIKAPSQNPLINSLPSGQSTLKSCINKQYSFSPKFDPHILRRLIIEWIVMSRHTFSEVENKQFRSIIHYLNADAVNAIPHQGNTIRADVLWIYTNAKQDVIQYLSKSKSKIHLSFDLWSSPNHKAYIDIIGHWISENSTVVSSLLALKEMKGGHTGEDMADIVFQVAKEFGIVKNLGWFVLDNATSNDKAIEFLEKYIHDEFGE